MYGVKSKQDVRMITALGAFGLLFLYLMYLSWGWTLMTAPFFWVAATAASLVIATGKLPPIDRTPVFATNVINVADEQIPCKLLLLEDRVLVVTKATGTPQERVAATVSARNEGFTLGLNEEIGASVPYWQMSRFMTEDVSVSNHSMAGVGIDFEDNEGTGRLLFFTRGRGAAKRNERLVVAIQGAQEHLTRGLNIDAIPLIDITAGKKYLGSQLIHRK